MTNDGSDDDTSGEPIGEGSDDSSDDHLERLSFDGWESTGTYGPDRIDLRLAGTNRLQDLVVALHEAHHASLNDSTAWGAALHVVARLGPEHAALFRQLLRAARLTHESFATFASVSIGEAQDIDASTVLSAYPLYAPLYRSTSRLVSAAGGPHRRYLAATAAARVSMQGPVAGCLVRCGLSGFSMSDLREIDTPDGRWRRLLREPTSNVRGWFDAADKAVESMLGGEALVADAHPDQAVAALDRYDDAWQIWEESVYDCLAVTLESCGAQALSYNGHQEAVSELVELARTIVPNLRLRVAAIGQRAPSDRNIAAAAIEPVRVHLSNAIWAGVIHALEPREIVDERATHEIAGEATLVIDARLGRRLRQLYHWSPSDLSWLESRPGPVVAVRLLQSAPEGVIVHCPVASPDDLKAMRDLWDGRGRVVSLVAVSTFIDRAWTAEWISPLRAMTSQVLLIDVEVDRFISNWVNGTIVASIATIEDASGISRYAATFVSDGVDALWVYLGDEVTVKLLVQQVALTDGIEIEAGKSLPQEWRTPLQIAATHLLASESFVDLSGVEGIV